jgi:predicted aspartyl protease
MVALKIAGRNWCAIIDTGFNGDVELPQELRGKLNDLAAGRLRSSLAGGQTIEEDAYLVDFPFDGKVFHAVATYVPSRQILIGTNLLRGYSLLVKFASGLVQLEREQT